MRRISGVIALAAIGGTLLSSQLSRCGTPTGTNSDVSVQSCDVDPMNFGEANIMIVNSTHTQQDYMFNVAFVHNGTTEATGSGSAHNVIPGEHRPYHLISDVYINTSVTCHITYSGRTSSDADYGVSGGL